MFFGEQCPSQDLSKIYQRLSPVEHCSTLVSVNVFAAFTLFPPSISIIRGEECASFAHNIFLLKNMNWATNTFACTSKLILV